MKNVKCDVKFKSERKHRILLKKIDWENSLIKCVFKCKWSACRLKWMWQWEEWRGSEDENHFLNQTTKEHRENREKKTINFYRKIELKSKQK